MSTFRRARVLVARPAVGNSSRIAAEHLSVEEVYDINELHAALISRKPAVLLLSMQFPGLNGAEGVRELRRLSASTRIIVLSRDANDQEELEMLRIGVKGYCSTADANVLLTMIDKVQQGEIWAARKTIGALVDEFYVTDPLDSDVGDTTWDRLTARQRDILRLLAEGASNKEIALALNVTVPTVKAHLTLLFRKLGQPDRFHLALYAVSRRRTLQ